MPGELVFFDTGGFSENVAPSGDASGRSLSRSMLGIGSGASGAAAAAGAAGASRVGSRSSCGSGSAGLVSQSSVGIPGSSSGSSEMSTWCFWMNVLVRSLILSELELAKSVRARSRTASASVPPPLGRSDPRPWRRRFGPSSRVFLGDAAGAARRVSARSRTASHFFLVTTWRSLAFVSGVARGFGISLLPCLGDAAGCSALCSEAAGATGAPGAAGTFGTSVPEVLRPRGSCLKPAVAPGIRVVLELA